MTLQQDFLAGARKFHQRRFHTRWLQWKLQHGLAHRGRKDVGWRCTPTSWRARLLHRLLHRKGCV
jgi:hypothetical protein